VQTDLKNIFETAKPHLETPNMTYDYLFIFIWHHPAEL
jgi:hypothetical protein